MKLSLFLAIALLLIGEGASAQSGPANFNQVVSRAENVKKSRPVENIYLQLDKPYYAAGDTVYFKAYVTLNEQHQPSPLSEVLHVDCIDPQGRNIGSIRLKLKQGMASGDLGLADSLPAGHYRVRAWTRWMLNEKNPSFFDRVIPVGSQKHPQTTAITTSKGSSGKASVGRILINKSAETEVSKPANADLSKPADPDVRFFPEGGDLLTGVETKVAFKITGKNGLGLKTKGVIIDNDGKEITRFQSAHLGMGFFFLKPAEGKIYKANLTFPDGSTGTADLPKATAKGMALSVENVSADTAIIHVLSSDAWLKDHQGEEMVLLIYSNGNSSITRERIVGADMGFAVNKHQTHSGIMRITLFSAHAEPLSERLFFIKNADQLDLDLKTDKTDYGKREKVQIALAARQANGPAQGNFSVSVVNEDLVKLADDKENTIFSQLMLSSEVKGYVEQPNYYFAHSGDEVDANLDILLLTQGYRHFVWKDILRDTLAPFTYKAEKFLQIQGFVNNAAGQPSKNETVTLTDASGQGPELKTKTDGTGRFTFPNLDFSDTVHFTITPEKPASRIVLSGYGSPAESEGVHPDAFAGDDLNTLAPYVKIATEDHEIRSAGKAQVLKPVVVKEKKPNKDDYYTLSLAGAGHADQVIHSQDILHDGSLSSQLDGRMRGVRFVNGVPYQIRPNQNMGGAIQLPMLVVIDGVTMEDSAYSVNQIPVADVTTVESLLSSNKSAYGMRGDDGVLVITTKQFSGEMEVEESPDPNVLQVALLGFYKAKEFYTPKYEIAAGANTPRDLRTTICWKPEVITDKDGHASFSFYNPDLPGTYRVVVEGMDKNGNLGRQTYKYQVQ